MKYLRKYAYGVVLLCFFMAPGTVTLRAEKISSSWVVNEYGTSRLLLGHYDAARQILHMGWQLKLKPGWKTYWRSPGEAGLPPRWHWQHMENIENIRILWPLPKRVDFFDMDTFVYYPEIIMPLEVKIKDGEKAADLSLKLDYMICKDICVPLEGTYGLRLENPEKLTISSSQLALLAKFQNKVPLNALASGIQVTDQGKGWIDITLKDSLKDIYVEAPEGYYLARPASRKGGTSFRVEYEKDADMPDLLSQELILTLVPVNGRAREVHIIVQSG